MRCTPPLRRLLPARPRLPLRRLRSPFRNAVIAPAVVAPVVAALLAGLPASSTAARPLPVGVRAAIDLALVCKGRPATGAASAPPYRFAAFRTDPPGGAIALALPTAHTAGVGDATVVACVTASARRTVAADGAPPTCTATLPDGSTASVRLTRARVRVAVRTTSSAKVIATFDVADSATCPVPARLSGRRAALLAGPDVAALTASLVGIAKASTAPAPSTVVPGTAAPSTAAPGTAAATTAAANSATPATLVPTTRPAAAGARCIVSLHGKGGAGSATAVEATGVTRLAPSGANEGWGGREWRYYPEAGYQANRGVVAQAVAGAGCARVIVLGFSNGAAFAAKLACRAETFGGTVIGYVIDDPVVDHAVDGCAKAAGVRVALYWTGAIDKPAGWQCASADWTCEGGETIGIAAYEQRLGVVHRASIHNTHTPYTDPPELTEWWR